MLHSNTVSKTDIKTLKQQKKGSAFINHLMTQGGGGHKVVLEHFKEFNYLINNKTAKSLNYTNNAPKPSRKPAKGSYSTLKCESPRGRGLCAMTKH